jgi:hypothetical protein
MLLLLLRLRLYCSLHIISIMLPTCWLRSASPLQASRNTFLLLLHKFQAALLIAHLQYHVADNAGPHSAAAAAAATLVTASHQHAADNASALQVSFARKLQQLLLLL